MAIKEDTRSLDYSSHENDPKTGHLCLLVLDFRGTQKIDLGIWASSSS